MGIPPAVVPSRLEKVGGEIAYHFRGTSMVSDCRGLARFGLFATAYSEHRPLGSPLDDYVPRTAMRAGLPSTTFSLVTSPVIRTCVHVGRDASPSPNTGDGINLVGHEGLSRHRGDPHTPPRSCQSPVRPRAHLALLACVSGALDATLLAS